MDIKHIFALGILGAIAGFLGAIIFQPITNIFSLIFSDFTLGGVLVGVSSFFLNVNQ